MKIITKTKKVIFIIFLLPFLSGCLTYTEGEKVGYVISVFDSGLFVKTTEVTLIRGGLNSGDGTIGNNFHLTINNQSKNDIYGKIIFAMKNNRKVKVYFHEEVFTWCRSDSGSYFIDDIEIIDLENSKEGVQ
jgi:hypothetical protein